jgi:hypothetical protein
MITASMERIIGRFQLTISLSAAELPSRAELFVAGLNWQQTRL